MMQMMQMMPISEQFFRQCGKKLMQPKARLVNEGDDGYLLIRRGKTDKRLARVSTAMLAAWRKADFVDAEGDEFVLSATGRAHLRRQSGDFIAQHRLDLETGDNTRPRQLASTPLQWLQARGRSKAFGLNAHELEAGGRLHEDFTRAMRSPHQTMDWSKPVFVDSSGGGGGDIPAAALDAQKRVAHALAYIGPGLADLALEVCCSQSGLEATEKKYALPRRSAKIMLKLALMRLSVHYGYQSASAAAASFRMR